MTTIRPQTLLQLSNKSLMTVGDMQHVLLIPLAAKRYIIYYTLVKFTQLYLLFQLTKVEGKEGMWQCEICDATTQTNFEWHLMIKVICFK